MATITIKLERKVLNLSKNLSSVALSKRNIFQQQFEDAIKNKSTGWQPLSIIPNSSLQINEFTLRRMIEKYSEQAVYRPIDDMRYFFSYARRAFTEIGYPPLFYQAVTDRRMTQNKSAISAIGEGIAGFISQKVYGCRKLARPCQDGVDIIMSADNTTYLVEAKGTALIDQYNWRDNYLEKAYLEELSREVLSSHGIDIRSVRGLLIGVHLQNELHYNCSIIEINIT